MKKILTFGIMLLFLGLACAPSINAEVNRTLDKNKEILTDNSTPSVGYKLRIGLGLDIYVWNYGNDTFRGNVSCKFITNATIMISGGYINITDYYVELEPQEEVLIYRGLIIGFGFAKAVLDMPPPVNIVHEFVGFILFIFLLLDYK